MSTGFDLDCEAKQTQFAELVGCTKQAISKRVERGVLVRGGTYRQWLKAYVDVLRGEAAGRGGDAQKTLTEQRIQESIANTMSKNIANMKEMGILVCVEEVAEVMGVFAREINGSFGELGSSIKAKFRSQFDELEFDDEFIDEPVRVAANRVAKTAEKLGQDLSADGGGLDA